PVVLAKDVATLDVLSDGRFELGLGAGWRRLDYEQAGIPYDATAVRLDRLEEAIGVLKALFATGPVDHVGRFYTVSDLDGTPKPVQQPHPPILVGGGGERVLSLAARVADIVSLAARARPDGPDWSSVTAMATADQIDWIRQAAGDQFDRLELNVMVYALAVTDDRQAAARQTAARWGLSEEEVLASPHALIGTVGQIGEDLLRYRERYGISYLIVPGIFAEAFAPVVARLAGR